MTLLALPPFEIFIAIETTGFNPQTGDRIVEIGAQQLIDGGEPNEIFHAYICPERPVPQSAVDVHGLSSEFLSDKPKFADIADALLEFIGEATLVVHNARFARDFLDAEMGRIGKDRLPPSRFVDAYLLAKELFPGQPASLNALAKRFNIVVPTNDSPGNLVSVALIADVYRALRKSESGARV